MSANLKVLDLRSNQHLLNPGFDGYKLCLNEIPIITQQLEVPILRLSPDSNQYSFLHAKLFGLYNHLVAESNDDESVYFIDKNRNINKLSIDQWSNQFSNTVMWQIPLKRERQVGDYDASLKLVSNKLAVVADGMGYLYVLDRGSDGYDVQWTVLFSGDVVGSDVNFVISDAVYKDISCPELHLLLLTIKQTSPEDRFCTKFYWITLVKTSSWNQTALRELTVNGFVQYAALENSCEAVFVVSDSSCKFTLDSENEVKQQRDNSDLMNYVWSQTKDDVIVKVKLPQNEDLKSSMHIKKDAGSIEIKCNSNILLVGQLHKEIDPDATYWNLQNDVLEVVLRKLDIGFMWPELLQGDSSGEYIMDSSVIQESVERLGGLTTDQEVDPPKGFTFNSQQVEDCDFECDKPSFFERLNCFSHAVTHRVNLCSHRVLLTVDLPDNSHKAFGIRSDVDVLIWEPIMSTDEFSLEHRGTLLALGYIQASKQQMKFFVASPNLNYSAICESTRHVFIYCQNKKTTSELKNRISGKRISTIAQQRLFSIPSNEEIFGLYASNTYLFILGESFITALKL